MLYLYHMYVLTHSHTKKKVLIAVSSLGPRRSPLANGDSFERFQIKTFLSLFFTSEGAR